MRRSADTNRLSQPIQTINQDAVGGPATRKKLKRILCVDSSDSEEEAVRRDAVEEPVMHKQLNRILSEVRSESDEKVSRL